MARVRRAAFGGLSLGHVDMSLADYNRGDPCLSIIIAVFCEAAEIEPALDHIATQTWPHREVLIVDGGSDDGAETILRRNDQRLAYWLSEPDQGIYDAWNKALPHVTGDWIVFMGVSDRFAGNDALALVAQRLRRLPADCLIAYGQVNLCDEKGRFVERQGEPWESCREKFRHQMCLPHQATFHRREAFVRFGMFDAKLQVCADYDFLLRLVDAHPPSFIGDVVVANWVQGGVSTSQESAYRAMREIQTVQRRHGVNSRAGRLLLVAAWIKTALYRWLGARLAHRLIDLVRRVKGRAPRYGP